MDIDIGSTTAICSIYNIEKYITSEDPNRMEAYKDLLNQVINLVKLMYENVIFITRISSECNHAYNFCIANGFVDYNFVSTLEESCPFIYKDENNEVYNKLWNYLVEHYK